MPEIECNEKVRYSNRISQISITMFNFFNNFRSEIPKQNL